MPLTFMPLADVGKLKAANFARDTSDVRPGELTRTVDEWADWHDSPGRRCFCAGVRVRRGPVRRPLSVHDGVLYDGHHRYAEARAAGQDRLPVVSPDDPRFNW